MKLFKIRENTLSFVALLGLIIFCLTSWNYANSQLSIGDEGAYLFKGYMFAKGDYFLFQEYGFWTNKAPLSFLIPGYIQLWFGPGLREGRYFAIFIGALTVIGIWIISNRLAGKTWAAIAVWVYALSFKQTAVMSLGVSQGLVACMTTWMFVIVLGKNRSMFHLIAGSILSVLIILTRQNMVLVPILLVLYIFWEYGRKSGLLSLTAILIVFTGFYIYYGSGLLNLWLDWLPNIQSPFDKIVISSPESTDQLEFTRLSARLRSVAASVQNHLFVMMGSVSALTFWVPRCGWKKPEQYKMTVFLAITFFSLFIMHAWASIFNDYCVLCLPSYQTFFNPAGVLFVILFFSNVKAGSKVRIILLSLVLILISGMLGIYYRGDWSDRLLYHFPIPLPGGSLERFFRLATLSDIFTYRFSIDENLQKTIASLIGGMLIGFLFIAILYLIKRTLSSLGKVQARSFIQTSLASYLILSIGFSTLLEFRVGYDRCGIKFLDYYEATGQKLQEIVPSDALVYWNGTGRQLAFMLYMTDVDIFPPQIHAGGGNYRTNDKDPNELLKDGRYNNFLDRQWREQADFYIIWSERPHGSFFDQPAYERVAFDIGGLSQCEDSPILFRRR